jgi:aldose 1-epimerase
MNIDPRQVPPHQLCPFGSLKGVDVPEIILRSPGGIEARIIPYGAIVRDFSVPTPRGQRQSVVLGYDTLDSYLVDPNYFGALVGRFANRIAGGRFSLNGVAYKLDRNEGGKTTLHGGRSGFSNQLWTVEKLCEATVTLGLVSPDGDQGFPGELTVLCRYEVCDRSGLLVEVTAQTTRPTPVSLAQHSYFTLGAQDIRDLLLTVHADQYTPVDVAGIPIGGLSAVEGTPFDFRSPRRVGTAEGRLDHNFVLWRAGPSKGPVLAATLENPNNGLILDVKTTQPGLQIYDGRMIRAPVPGGSTGAYSGICLETQSFPDTPNQPGFPDSILQPDRIYRHFTSYRVRESTAAEVDGRV